MGHAGRQLRAQAPYDRRRDETESPRASQEGFARCCAAFETAIIERYRRRESSVEEALMEMCLAGVSVRRVEDITEALWAWVSPGTVSNLNKKIYAQACARA